MGLQYQHPSGYLEVIADHMAFSGGTSQGVIVTRLWTALNQ